jgi:hypothetical protein
VVDAEVVFGVVEGGGGESGGGFGHDDDRSGSLIRRTTVSSERQRNGEKEKTRKEGFNTEDTESGGHGEHRVKSGHEIGWYLLDSRRFGAYCRRTLVGTPGASHFSQVLHRRANAASPTLREICE